MCVVCVHNCIFIHTNGVCTLFSEQACPGLAPFENGERIGQNFRYKGQVSFRCDLVSTVKLFTHKTAAAAAAAAAAVNKMCILWSMQRLKLESL